MTTNKKGKYHLFFGEDKNIPSIPEVIAHRGGAGEWPGETIYAFEEAVKIGVDVLEMDIRYTSDDEPILMHNRNVLETTGVDKRVEEFTSDEIQQLDAAYWWKQAGKTFPWGAKLGVPRLEDVLENFRGMRMNIEIKPFQLPIRLIKKLGKLLRDYEMTETVLVASGCHMNLLFFRRECPQVATSASVPELFSFRALKSVGYKPNCNALQLSSKAGPLHFITQKYVDKAHSLDLKVHGWTVNKPEEMGRLISLGVDGIITDYPTVLLEFLGRL
ncbi:MAG: glycerophosphodiester phosphodiesterase [Acidobacteriota bacterium]|nr:glycerophosphodiester phosphodiesterase [Acidobacteriota bacterium]